MKRKKKTKNSTIKIKTIMHVFFITNNIFLLLLNLSYFAVNYVGVVISNLEDVLKYHSIMSTNNIEQYVSSITVYSGFLFPKPINIFLNEQNPYVFIPVLPLSGIKQLCLVISALDGPPWYFSINSVNQQPY